MLKLKAADLTPSSAGNLIYLYRVLSVNPHFFNAHAACAITVEERPPEKINNWRAWAALRVTRVSEKTRIGLGL
jgi:hypothetical protein